MAGQQSGRSESPPALGAVVRLQAAVDAPVLHQRRMMLEAFAAFRTFVRRRRGRGQIRSLRRVGKVGRRGRVRGEFFVKHDDLGNVVVVVAGARVGGDGHFQRRGQRQGRDEEIVRVKRSCVGAEWLGSLSLSHARHATFYGEYAETIPTVLFANFP